MHRPKMRSGLASELAVEKQVLSENIFGMADCGYVENPSPAGRVVRPMDPRVVDGRKRNRSRGAKAK